MKKLTVGLAVLLSSYAASSLAALPTGACSRCDVNVPSYCGGFTFGATGLYWRPSSSQLDYAVTFPGTFTQFGPSGSLNNGHHHHVDHDYDWGFKANIGYVFPCSGNDVNLTYTHWDNDEHDGTRNIGRLLPGFSAPFFLGGRLPAPFLLSTPVTLIGASVGFSPVGVVTGPFAFTTVLPGVIIPIDPSDITDIRARSDFENHTWDLDFGQTITASCNFRLRWFGGVRWTKLEHDLDVTTEAVKIEDDQETGPLPGLPATITTVVTTPAAIPTTATVATISDVTATIRDFVHLNSEFDGVGPRFGIEASYHLGGGFGVVGNLSTSLLVGETNSSYNERVEGAGIVSIEAAAVRLDPTVVPGVSTAAPVLFPGTFAAVAVPPFGTPIPVVFDPAFSAISSHHPDDTRIVPNIDAKLGLDWTYQFCNCSRSKVTVEAGYMISHYFYAIDRLSALDAIAPEARSRDTIDVSFDGPYVSVQVNL